MSAPFTATKFDREYEGTRPICDEDCAEFMMGAADDACGYAPGEYMIRCHKCGQYKHGMDKRAITCAECAKKARAAAAAPHFDIPFPPVPRPEEAALRQMRDALQKAWIVFDSLRTYRTEDELLEIIGSDQFAAAREAVRQAGALQIGGQK